MESEVIVKFRGDPSLLDSLIGRMMDGEPNISACFFLTVNGQPVIHGVRETEREDWEARAIAKIVSTL
jgi:hypothetical protein